MENDILSRLRMQEVNQVILSVAKGAVITGTDLKENEPVMIIKEPAMSDLSFVTNQKTNIDSGFISASGMIKRIDFTINEGTILYSVWSYLHGLVNTHKDVWLKGTEYLTLDNDERKLFLSAHTNVRDLIVYTNDEGKLVKLKSNKYRAYYEIIDEVKTYIVELDESIDNKDFFVCYNYVVKDTQQTLINEINNNIFCSLDIYFDAVDVLTDDKYTVCLHCDKVQVFSDLKISMNNSNKASFTPIEICSCSEGDINRSIASLTVI